MSDTCKSCRFWNASLRAKWNDVGRSGTILVEHAQCRRYAPSRLMADMRALPEKSWPHVNATDWCGEHSARLPVGCA